MKKFLSLIVICLGLVCYALLSASDKQAVDQEPYDEDTYGPEAPIIWTKPVRGVVFNHKTHTMDAEMDCESCHDDLFAMEAGLAQENDDFNMESLYAGNYCGACHDGDTAFASDTRCTTCHIGVRGVARLTAPSEGAEHNAH